MLTFGNLAPIDQDVICFVHGIRSILGGNYYSGRLSFHCFAFNLPVKALYDYGNCNYQRTTKCIEP